MMTKMICFQSKAEISLKTVTPQFAEKKLKVQKMRAEKTSHPFA